MRRVACRRVAVAVAVLAGMAAGSAGARAQAIDLSHGGPVNVTAAGGIDWDQAAQTVTARDQAEAVRGDVTVTGDALIAHYRKKAGAPASSGRPPGGTSSGPPPGGAAPAPSPAGVAAGGDMTSGNEIYRLEADGTVHIFTNTDQAWGDHATYDIDQSVLVLTGHALRLLTPQDLLTARDAMEYWSARHLAVGRGDASVTTQDGRRVQADVLVGYTSPDTAAPGVKGAAAPGAKGAAASGAKSAAASGAKSGAASGAKSAAAPGAAAPGKPPKPGADPLASSGKLQKVEAFGHVRIRTATDIVTGDKGVYIPDTGMARIVGDVHITRGENQLNGAAAIVNMKTGLATLTEAPGARVKGLVVPNEPKPPPAAGTAPAGKAPAGKGSAGEGSTGKESGARASKGTP